MNNRPIGIFDSGVGGLTVLSEIEKLLPLENFTFLADQANVPYGAKTKDELARLTERIVSFLIKREAKIVVAACNTASVYALPYLRSKFDIPIIGVVPVIKTISKISKSRKVITFSTPATAKSPYLKKLIDEFAPDLEVYTLGGNGLEELIEEGNLENPQIDEIIKTTLLPYIEKGADVIGLACTHYPFLKDKISKIVGDSIQILDSGGAVARRVKQVLENENILSSKKADDFYYTTGDSKRFKIVACKLLLQSLANVKHAEI